MRFTIGKRTLAVGTALCAAAFVSVGFASWYITGQPTYDFESNVSVEGVVGNTANVVISSDQLKQSVVYGSPSEAAMAAGSSWLYSDGELQENLTLTYDLTFENVTSASCLVMELNVIKPSSTAFEASFSQSFGYSSASYDIAVEAEYIAPVEQAEIEVTNQKGVTAIYSQYDGNNSVTFTFDTSAPEHSARVTISFLWGDMFGGKNPYYTFKDLTDEAEQLEAADTLAHIEACLDRVGYQIRFTRTEI